MLSALKLFLVNPPKSFWNWLGKFSSTSFNKSELETCFSWVCRVRDNIAHTRPVADDDYLMFMAGARWIQVRMQYAQKDQLKMPI